MPKRKTKTQNQPESKSTVKMDRLSDGRLLVELARADGRKASFGLNPATACDLLAELQGAQGKGWLDV